MSKLTKYGRPRPEVLEACKVLTEILKVELATALTNQRAVHAQGEFTEEDFEKHVHRMGAIFETSKIVANCLMIESFIDHIKKEIF